MGGPSPRDGLFALGVPADRYRLPHPRLGLAVILLIRQALLRAFEILRERRGSLDGYTEDEITFYLHGILENDLRQTGSVPGFNRAFYDAVVRQAEVANFNLEKLKKEPDLCFRLRHSDAEPRPVLSAYEALFVECKPIDKSHAAGGKYCDAGLVRFVEGDYAWAMEEALMLGYARHGRTITGHLLPAIREPRRRERLKVVEMPRPVDRRDAKSRGGAEALHVSRHRRDFTWMDGKGRATEILVYHCWRDCD